MFRPTEGLGWRLRALLKAAERHYGLISSVVDCLFDTRQAAKVDHPLKDLFEQRVFSIACGYSALTDCARAQVWMLRERFLKLGARVVVCKRSEIPSGRVAVYA